MVEFMKLLTQAGRGINLSLRECPSEKICSQYVKKETKDRKICCVGWCHRRTQFKEDLSGKPGPPDATRDGGGDTPGRGAPAWRGRGRRFENRPSSGVRGRPRSASEGASPAPSSLEASAFRAMSSKG